MKAILIVLDSVGIGAAPDAADYGDTGANTLAHVAEAVGGIGLRVLGEMGLGNIPEILPNGMLIAGVPPAIRPTACFGAMREVSIGKDTTTGHWEMTGLRLSNGFRIGSSFPADLIREFEVKTGRKCIGNCAASGTDIIRDLGPQQIKDGCWIVYTSADSVFQIAAHEQVIPLDELYRACEIARDLCNPLMVGRVIARPYAGEPGNFIRTANRRDYSYPLPGPTILDRLVEAGIPVIGLGKIDDIFTHRGFTLSFHSETNSQVQSDFMKIAKKNMPGLVFANLVDFDMLYGHRRDPVGYASALTKADAFLWEVISMMKHDDMLIVTADHGNDPTFKGTDHTREYVPLLVYRPGKPGINLGIRDGFYDVAQSLAAFFGIRPMPLGVSVL